ncbi:carbohydrate sulfotransferase 15-like [Babylonia areolata]|uniref:carbohydrate sulfotransferase 15-like n=1 Tax=Babylonia areolata TaxID=304850 RepID=UPI003FD049D6
MLFSQSAWDNVQNDEDWDSIFDTDAWSSLLNEGFVGANVKDELPLPRFKKITSGAAMIPKDAFKAKVPVQPVVPEKIVISLGLSKAPSELLTVSRKRTKDTHPVHIDTFPARPPSDQPKTFEWFDSSYRKSATYGKAKEFVEDEALFGSCGSSIIAARNWAETLLPLGPFHYLSRSKNPCWYPEDGGAFTCMPYFYLVGVSGPATDDVMQHILLHPHVTGHTQPLAWWDVGRHAGKSWEEYSREFQRLAEDIILDINEHKTSNIVFGDSSSTYFSSPTGWERLSGNENCAEPRVTLASHLRRLRLKGLVMVVLPHPTRRLIAETRRQSKGKLNPQQFHNDVQRAINTYKNCFSQFSLRQCAYNATLAKSVKLSLHEGMYSVYMEDWIRIFPPEQFLVLRYEDYINNTVPTLQRIYSFLGIPEIVPEELTLAVEGQNVAFREVVRGHNPGNVLPTTLHMLNDFYTPFLLRLAQIMGDPVKFTWQDT